MSPEQRYQQFINLYYGIVKSNDAPQMERLGEMTKRVMHWLCMNEPDIAAQAIALIDGHEELQQPRNYLTGQEAQTIAGQMNPQPKWTLRELEQMLAGMNLPTACPPYYDSNALLTTMLMILSDSGQTLQRIIGSPSHPATNEELLASVYQLAVDKLKDKDGKFNIRKYFDL